MFERFTERARRSVFFARYEASTLCSLELAPEHILLGILREDKNIAALVGAATLDSIRSQLRQRETSSEKIPVSVDLPVSPEAKRALVSASQEADALEHRHVDTAHLVLGLMHLEGSLAARFLHEHGVNAEEFRKSILPDTSPPAVGSPPEGT